jgi:hypothetical protein
MPTDSLVQRLGQFLAETLPVSPALASVLAVLTAAAFIVVVAGCLTLALTGLFTTKQE